LAKGEEMSAPEKCPFCQADKSQIADGRWAFYTCGTCTDATGKSHDQGFSVRCLLAQRDQLRAQVEQWKAYAERLEANQCEPEPSAWTTVESFTHPSFDGPFHDVSTSIYTVPLYRKAKETKP
jgi:hypothetical protein